MADDLARMLAESYGDDPRTAYRNPLMELSKQQFAPFPTLPPLPDRRPSLSNDHSRPTPKLQDELASYISPTMGAYGMASLGTTAAMDATHGKYDPETILPLAAAIFAGPRAKTADLAALTRAQEMAAKGAPREAIWNDTGWFQGRDNKWRWEIDDSTSRFNEVNRGPTSDYLTHPGGMFKAYRDVHGLGRDLGDVDVLRSGLPGTGAYMRGDTHVPPTEIISIGRESADPRSVALHEYQHAIAPREGFEGGSSPERARDYLQTLKDREHDQVINRISEVASQHPEAFEHFKRYNGALSMGDIEAANKAETALLSSEGGAQLADLKWRAANLRNYGVTSADAFDAYKRYAGEVEARNVQTRMNMTPEERRAKPPWETQDVPDLQQILREYGNRP